MTRGAKIGLVIFVALILFVVVGEVIERKQQPMTPDQQRIVGQRAQFANSSSTCKTLETYGGCHYNPDAAPNALVIFVYRVKPQFRQRVVSDLLGSNDLVPALRKAGFRKVTFTTGGWSPDFQESYDLVTKPVSKMEGNYEP